MKEKRKGLPLNFWQTTNHYMEVFTPWVSLTFGIVLGTFSLSMLMIKIVETRPAEEWQGIAYALLCQVVPVIGALIVALSVMIKRDERQLANLRKVIADREARDE